MSLSLSALLKLPAGERAELAMALWESLSEAEREGEIELTPDEARVSCYFTVVTEIGLDHYGRYRDVFVPVGDDWLIRHRFVSTD